MMKYIQMITLSSALFLQAVGGFAQTSVKKTALKNTAPQGLSAFPELQFTRIPGAPRLSAPVLLKGSEQAIVSEGFGLAAPAYYDWDHDGAKDLLIGEFGSGTEHGNSVGSFIRVYKNTGSSEQPAFTGRWNYAKAPFEILTTGTPYSVDQGCCIGFTPQVIDLDQDGITDIVTGQYYGEVSWLKGTKEGFLPAQALPQEGDPRGKDWVKNQDYWLFSSASFGDFTGDGLPDLITGGTSLRISKNTGTKGHPFFAHREPLLDVTGAPLKVYQYNQEELTDLERYVKDFGMTIPPTGDQKVSPYVVDWDQDGVPDLLVTNSYTHQGLSAVSFFKGVKTREGIRFQQAVSLFTTKENMGKTIPGSGPRIFVCDWNNDGVNDLLIGASVATMKGEFSDRLSWNWEHAEDIQSAGKDPGNLHLDAKTMESQKAYYEGKLPKGIGIDDYMTIKHRGYVYLMLGQK